jgi:gliding motility-associated-like protein
MVKKIIQIFFICIMLFVNVQNANAEHISGGELTYRVLSINGNKVSYEITMRLLKDCDSRSQVTLPTERVEIGVFNTSTLNLVSRVVLSPQFSNPVPVIQNTPGANPCLTGNPKACYQVGIYRATIELDINATGYTLSWVRYTRQLLANVQVDPRQTGAVFTTQIPGTNMLPIGVNNSALFSNKDTTIICKNTNFRFEFNATDADGDSLSYKFVTGYDGVVGDNPNSDPNPSPSGTLNIFNLSYLSPFSGTQPLGATVTINAKSGLISGIAPGPGKYVICVVAEEWRNGKLINNHRKDFILAVNDCSLAGAELKPSYRNCKDYQFQFSNESTSANITKYLWTFDSKNPLSDTSQQAQPIYIYKDTGVYTLKLWVEAAGGCQDSTTTEVRVFPGFVTNFSFTGGCITNPVLFNDLSTTRYGLVDRWSWNFGDPTVINDTSSKQNPQYKYPQSGLKNVSLVIGTNRGCIDTLFTTITIFDKPPLQLPFKDTLICSIDSLPLIANGTGNFTWTPNINIFDRFTNRPTVYPKDTTTYYVQLDRDGCISNDSIKVNVLDFITVELGVDSTICLTDTAVLTTVSHALSYRWTTNTTEIVQNKKSPTVRPISTTTYFVTANLGKCLDKDDITLTTIPYPRVTASDESICFGNKVTLNATIIASSFTWLSNTTLINTKSLQPVAGPSKTTNYFITVSDTLGCPKPVTDTATVIVIPPIVVNAGNDTTVVVGQPLQFNTLSSVTNNVQYTWSPAFGLNNPNIANPIGIYNSGFDLLKYAVIVTTPQGCKGADSIAIKVFNTRPDIFVPSAFTPNKNGLNDILIPITVGITNIKYFSIYNRLGQLVFTTSQIGKGWDGTLNGIEQPSGTFVYQVQGNDFTGKTIFKKGTVVLIR